MTIFSYQQYSPDYAKGAIGRLKEKHLEMLERLQDYKIGEIQALEDALNAIFTNEHAIELLSATLSNMQKEVDKAVTNMEISPTSGRLQYKKNTHNAIALKEAYAKYFEEKTKVNKHINNLQDEILQNDLKKAWGAVMKLQTPINQAYGKMFENLLTYIGANINGLAQEKSSEIVTQELNNIIQQLGKEKSVIKSKGSEQISLELQIDDKKVKWHGPGKVDASMPSPFIDDDQINISAKSYSSVRNINLLSGQIVPLIADWPIENNDKNYFYNALHIDRTETFLNHTRLMFAVQSMAGLQSSSQADILVVYIRSRKKRPIIVYSIRALLKDILGQKKMTDIRNAIPMKLSASLPIKTKHAEDFHQRAWSLKISTELNKQYLALKYINSLQR